ncbi:MAG: hypothetical protein L0312_11830, partial [Acidobacteria bacterium]|nr:hypothetical protein [Acidobacteriota bacterium]
MSSLLLARFHFLLPQLILFFGSLLWHASILFSCPEWRATQPHFHVQLFYRCQTHDWESFFSLS